MIETLTTGKMTLSGTNSPPAEVSTSDRNTDYWADDTLGLIVLQQRYQPSDRNTDYWADDTLWD